MMKKLMIAVLFAGLMATAMAQESRDMARAMEGYLSQVKFAKQNYLQKMEKIKKASVPGKEEMDAANTAYQSQIKFAEQAYVKKLETYMKTPARPKGEVDALREEISRFKGQMTNGNAPLPDVPGADDAAKNAGKADSPAKELGKDKGGKEVVDKDDDDDGKSENVGNVAGIGAPGEKFSEVKADSLDDGSGAKGESLKVDIGDLSADWLKEHRQFASARPRPENYDFKEDSLKAYLAGIPEDKRSFEEKRFRQVSGIKNYIVRLMERNTYPKPLTLKDGDTIRGIMVNPNFVSVKSGRKKFTRLGWDSVPVDQIASILEYFAEFRLRASGGPAVQESQKKKEVAEDYIRIGILCDWYGDYESAVKYSKKSISIEPKAEDVVKKFMMQ